MWVGNTGEDQGAYEDLAFFTGDAYGGGECSQNFWQYRYKGILRCNIAIERIPDVEFEDESLRDRYVAEAKFLRAYQYFDLVRYFGGVPLVLGMKMPSEIEGIQRASAAEVYTQIENDLKDAANVLPVKGEYASADLGRATKGAAQGLLAKAYLYQEKYEEAEDMLEQVMGLNGHASQGYDLLDDFGDVWSISHNNSVESLFEVQTNSDIAYSLGLRMPVVCGSRDDGGWAWGLPTSNLETAFKTAGDDILLHLHGVFIQLVPVVAKQHISLTTLKLPLSAVGVFCVLVVAGARGRVPVCSISMREITLAGRTRTSGRGSFSSPNGGLGSQPHF